MNEQRQAGHGGFSEGEGQVTRAHLPSRRPAAAGVTRLRQGGNEGTGALHTYIPYLLVRRIIPHTKQYIRIQRSIFFRKKNEINFLVYSSTEVFTRTAAGIAATAQSCSSSNKTECS